MVQGVLIVFVRQEAGDGVAEKLLRRANIGIHPQRFSATFGVPDTAKPALGGLLWCVDWWSRGGDLVGKILIYKIHIDLFFLEYHLEYGAPRGHPFWQSI